MKKYTTGLSRVLVALAFCGLPGMAAAQDANQKGSTTSSENQTSIEEVIVTAQKRQENLQTVPISIAVVSGEDLKEAHVDSVAELQRSVAGFSLKRGGTFGSTSNNVVLFIRGAGTLIDSNAIQPSVGTVIDGVAMGRSALGLFNFDDVQRIEVLRGPQGTLFGMNASGGVLNIVTKDPTDQFSGNIGLGYGSYNEFKINGAISGPLIQDRLSARISFYNVNREGYITNIANGQKVNDKQQYGIRGKLLFTPSEKTRITLSADTERSDAVCCVSTYRNIVPAYPYDANLIAAVGSVAGPTNHYINGGGKGPYADDKMIGSNLQWDQYFGDYVLTSITGYRTWKLHNHSTLDDTPIDQNIYTYGDVNQRQRSQEFRLASPKGTRFDYVVGLFYFNQRVAASNDALFDLAVFGAPGLKFRTLDYGVTKTENYAGFGDANFHVTDAVTLFGGVRWTHEKVSLHLVGLPRPAGQFPFGVPEGTVDDSVTVQKLSGRVGARWQLDQDNMLYTTVSRGYKGPGFNSVSGLPGVSQRVASEISTSYEVGLKSQFWDDRVRANLALFQETFSDFQAQGQIGTPPTVITSLVNAGKIRSRGVEVDVTAVPTDNLSLDFSGALIDGIFKEFPNAPCFTGQPTGCNGGIQDLAGKPLASVPKWSFNINAKYEFPIADAAFKGYVRAEYSWRDKVQWDVFQSPNTISGSNGQLGVSTGIDGIDGKYNLSIYVKNVLNNAPQAPLFVSGSLGASTVQFLPPDYQRIFGVNLQYNF